MRNSTTDKIEFTLVLVRHGKTIGNIEKRYIGRTDESLCEEGIQELKQNLGCGMYLNADLVFSSPMKRCVETSEILFPETMSKIISDFREIDFGEFEGKNHEELNGRKDYQDWINSNGTISFPGGEGQNQFIERCVKGFDELIDCVRNSGKIVPNGKKIVVCAVVHGGTIMSILSTHTGKQYYDFMLKNGEGYICKVSLEAGKIQIDNVERL